MKNIKRRLLLLFLAIVVMGWIMGQCDYSRLDSGKQPLFARLKLALADGGSTQYLGLGYTITDLHEYRWGYEIQTDVVTNAAYEAAPYNPYRVGPVLTYWTPFMSREDTRYVVETNK
jgi:hypothetical protein